MNNLLLNEIENELNQNFEIKKKLKKIHKIIEFIKNQTTNEECSPITPCPSRRSQRTEESFTFTPTISNRSRKIAERTRDPSKLFQPPLRVSKTECASPAVSIQSSSPPSVVSQKLIKKIESTFGSLDEYYESRRRSMPHMERIVKDQIDMMECTFHPKINSKKNVQKTDHRLYQNRN